MSTNPITTSTAPTTSIVPTVPAPITTTTIIPTTTASTSATTSNLGPITSHTSAKLSLPEAIQHVDSFLQQLNTTTLSSTIRELTTLQEQADATTFSRAEALNDAINNYISLVRQDKEMAIQAETHATTQFDVERGRDDINNAKKHAAGYKQYRDNEQRECDAIQYQINAIKAGIGGNTDDNDGDNGNLNGSQEGGMGDEDDEDKPDSFDAELDKLNQDISSLEAKLHIYQQLSHVTFAEHNNNNSSNSTNPHLRNSAPPGGTPSIIQGFATLNNLGDIRPFDIDLDATSAVEIHDMIWGWLYDEHCAHQGGRRGGIARIGGASGGSTAGLGGYQ